MIHRNKTPIEPEVPGRDEFKRIHGYSIDNEPEAPDQEQSCPTPNKPPPARTCDS